MPSKQEFDFDAAHNGVQCIASLDPKDRGTEHQFWFTRQMLAKEFDITAPTVTNNVEALANRGVLTVEKNFATVPMTNTAGAVNETTLYDLKVFNYLAMRLDTDKAWEKKARFNDVLVKHETGITPPELSDEEIMSRALEIAHRTLALREERIKALQAERDEAIRTKTQYQSRIINRRLLIRHLAPEVEILQWVEAATVVRWTRFFFFVDFMRPCA